MAVKKLVFTKKEISILKESLSYAKMFCIDSIYEYCGDENDEYPKQKRKQITEFDKLENSIKEQLNAK